MLKKCWMAAAAGLVALLSGGQQAKAQSSDTMRLGGNIEAKTTTMSYDGLSETILTRGVRGGVGGGRGGFGGARGGVGFAGARGGIGVAGFRGGVGVGYRGGYGIGYGRGGYGYGGYGYGGYGYGGWGFGLGLGLGYGLGYGWGGYYPPYYYYPSYYPSYVYSSPSYYYAPAVAPVSYAPASGYYPISATTTTGGAATYRPALSGERLPQPLPAKAVPMLPADGGTYLYDGGPASPVPMPATPPATKIQPVDSRFVSITTTKGPAGFSYAAYGDKSPAKK